MNEVIETSGSYRVRLEWDGNPVNPREDYDQLVYALTVPNSYYDDVAESGPLGDTWDRIKHRSDAVELVTRWARIFHGAVVDTHTPQQGPNSVWYILPEQIAEIGVSPEKAIHDAITEYQNWAEGEVYGYIIEKKVAWVPKDDPSSDVEMTTWEEVEDGSCRGIIGYDWAVKEAKEAFTAHMQTL